MSFSKRCMSLLKSRFLHLNAKPLRERVPSGSIIGSITKIKLTGPKHLLNTAVGMSSVALCAGIAFYTSYESTSPETTMLSDEPPGLVSEADGTSVCQTSSFNEHICEKNCKEIFNNACASSSDCLLDIQRVTGAPAISVCVSINGEMVWAEGCGYADVEQHVDCKSSTVMRIASISKPMTMAVVARLIDQGKINIEEPVQTYLPKYPTAAYKGKKVLMKVKHVLSNTSGIRHYCIWHENDKKEPKKIVEMDTIYDKDLSKEEKLKVKKENMRSYLCKLQSGAEGEGRCKNEYNLQEFLIKENFSSVEEALQLFQNDELFCEPGTDFKYTTHGWTLVSAIVEAASGKKFETLMKNAFAEIGLKSTCFEKSAPIIHNRARQYIRSSNGRLENAPYVDNSYKYAGGGLLSNVEDLVDFGNVMLFSYQIPINATGIKGYIERPTIDKMWSPSPGTETDTSKSRYGLGWFIMGDRQIAGMCAKQPLTVYHTGGAVGGSSILFIRPNNHDSDSLHPPEGIVVAMLTNLEGVSLLDTARKISDNFNKFSHSKCAHKNTKQSFVPRHL